MWVFYVVSGCSNKRKSAGVILKCFQTSFYLSFCQQYSVLSIQYVRHTKQKFSLDKSKADEHKLWTINLSLSQFTLETGFSSPKPPDQLVTCFCHWGDAKQTHPTQEILYPASIVFFILSHCLVFLQLLWTSWKLIKRWPRPGCLLILLFCATGLLSVNSALDFELCREYYLSVEGARGKPSLSDIATVIINITDVNDNPPVFNRSYSAVISEDISPGDMVLQVSRFPLTVTQHPMIKLFSHTLRNFL